MKTLFFKPKEKKTSRNITLWVPPDYVARLDKIAEKVGATRAEILRQAIHFALENMEKE